MLEHEVLSTFNADNNTISTADSSTLNTPNKAILEFLLSVVNAQLQYL